MPDGASPYCRRRPPCLWLRSPDALPFVGLSGVLCGLFVHGLWPQAVRGAPHAVIALIGLAAWLLWQGVAGPLPAEDRLIGVAHVYGARLALAALLIDAAISRGRARHDERDVDPQ